MSRCPRRRSQVMVDMRAGSAVAQTIPSHTYSAFGAECIALTHAVALTLRGCRCRGSRLLTAGRRGWLLVLLRSPPGHRVDLPDGRLTRGHALWASRGP